MRTPEEIVKEKFGDDLSGYLYVTPYDLITFYKETWNEALDAVINHPENIWTKYEGEILINKEIIEKLKK